MSIPYGTDYPEAPWIDRDGQPMPTDTAQLLGDVEGFVGKFLALPSRHHLPVLCLWILHTWVLSAFYVTPRLVLDSPEPNSGKTRVLEVLVLLCRGAKLTLSTTTAALYRRIAAAGDKPPTVLQDEADAIFGRTVTPQAEDLRALFNSGYKRGATVDRCEGDAKNMKVREFPVFAPVALAGLAGKMPATITSRAITMHMRRRAPDELVSEFRERDAVIEAKPLKESLEAWAEARHDKLVTARPTMPSGVTDRAAEVWEALLAIADLASGDWPARARDACEHFVLNVDPDELPMGARLLSDIQDVFKEEARDGKMFSVDIISALTSDFESEWTDMWGKPLDQRRLAKELKRYGVRSKDVRVGLGTAKGYTVEGEDGLGQAWRRYLPSAYKRDNRDKRDTAGRDDSDPRHERDKRDKSDGERDKRDTNATDETPSNQQVFENVADVAAVADTDGNGQRATDSDAYRNGLCRDCHTRPYSPGRPRCEQCHRVWANIAAGYDR